MSEEAQVTAAAPEAPVSVVSTSDARVVNNTLRHEYRVLTETEKAQITTLKDIGQDFLGSCDSFKQSAEMTLAKRKMEEAVMWAVKALTQ